jgi:hypothetical protein
MKFPLRLSLWAWPLLAGALASLIYGLQHRMGIEINADGWAYWQGAQSIADGLGYRYFSGDPIVAWPPLYSLYLSSWIKLCGSQAIVLILANIVLIFLQGVLWTLVYYCLFAVDPKGAAIRYVTTYVALTIPLYEKQILAHNLLYSILPVFVITTWKRINHCGRLGRSYTVITCCLGILLAESHISGIAYVAAAAFLFAVVPDDCRRDRTVAALAVLAVPLAAWILTAWSLAQIGGHPIEGGRYSIIETLLQMSDGIGYFVLPRLGRIFGLIALIVILGASLSCSSKLRSNQTFFVFAFSLISLFLLATAFSITWLNGFVSESRHLLIVPLLIIPILVSYLMTSNTVVMKAAALLVFLAPVSRTLFLSDSVTSDDFVPIYASISPIPGFGKTINVNGKTLVGPIAWEEPEGGYSSSGAPRWGSSQTGAAGPR